jgi:hypothetical protein
MQTDDDTDRPEEYCRNRIASIDDKEDAEEDEEDEKVEDDDDEYEKVQSPHGLRYPIALTLPYFITHPQSIAQHVENP